MKIIGFIGYSNAGKTTLIEKLVRRFSARGLRVAAVKHAFHGFDVDRPGKDSYRYRAAGAEQVLIAAGARWALLSETPRAPAPLDALLERLAPCDLAIVEGFRGEGAFPRIEVRRDGCVDPPLYPADRNVIALATDYPLDAPLPRLDLNDAAMIADFVDRALALQLHP